MKPFTLPPLLLLLAYTPLGTAQTCSSNITADAPDSRYILNTNGTALDKKTGLLWMRCALGQFWTGDTCIGLPQSSSWQQALQSAENKVFAGQSDWRLPNIKELQSLLESSCYSPAINLTVFPNASSDLYWSSSPVAYSGNGASTMNFYSGFSSWHDKYDAYYIRLVHGGQ